MKNLNALMKILLVLASDPAMLSYRCRMPLNSSQRLAPGNVTGLVAPGNGSRRELIVALGTRWRCRRGKS